MRHLLSVLLCFFVFTLMGETLMLNPQQRPVVILMSPQINGVAQGVAKELAEHFELATGYRPQIFTNEAEMPEGAFAFRFGLDPVDESLKFYQANWRCDADSLSISGNSSNGSLGILFATYEWLDKALGCRWLWPGELGRIVPKTTIVSLETGKGVYTPSLQCANWRPCSNNLPLWKTHEGWEQFFSSQQEWFYRNRSFNNMALQFYPHGFEDWYGRFSETHPEYFQMLPNGERKPDPTYINGAPTLISMCVSNPDFIRQTVQDWQDEFNPE